MRSKRKAAVAAALALGATAALSGGSQAVARQAGGFTDRGDIRFLPQPLKDRLALLAGRRPFRR